MTAAAINSRSLSSQELAAMAEEIMLRLIELRARLAAQEEYERGMPARTEQLDRDEPERRLAPRLQDSIDQAHADLVALHAGMVIKFAHDWSRYRRDLFDEYVQAGNVGVMEAIANWDPTRGASFSTWAWNSIRRNVSAAHTAANDTPLSNWDQKIAPRVRATQRAMIDADHTLDPLDPKVIAACRAAVPDGAGEETIHRILTATRMTGLEAIGEMGTPCHAEQVEDKTMFEALCAMAERDLDHEAFTSLVMRLGLDGQPAATWAAIGEVLGLGQAAVKRRYEDAIDTLRGGMQRTPAGMF